MIVAELLTAPGELSEQARARLRSLDGLMAALISDVSAAHAELDAALEWFDAHDDDAGRVVAFAGLGIATAPVDAERARTFMLEGARLSASLGDAWSEALMLAALGWLDVGRGDFTREDLIERAYSHARYVDDEITTAHAATNLAELHLARGRPGEARELLLDVAFTAYEELHMSDGLSYALEAAAGLMSSEDRPEEAARLLGAADGVREEGAIPIWGPRLTRFTRLVGSARATLGDERFEETWSEGRALGFDAALEHARHALRPAELEDTA